MMNAMSYLVESVMAQILTIKALLCWDGKLSDWFMQVDDVRF